MMLLPTLLLIGAHSQAVAASIVVHVDKPAHAISPDLFGVFFEEINHAGDGGLNPELVRNFNFREPMNGTQCPGWTLLTPHEGTINAGRTGMLIERSVPGDQLLGASNDGYWGIPVTAGTRYRFGVNCYSDTGVPIVLQLRDAKGQLLGAGVAVPSAETSLVSGVIKATQSAVDAHLEVGIQKAGKVGVKSVSLLPADTWKGHGLRPDLASLVDGLKPAFVRFPGGCYVEGGDYLRDRFKWETTLVPPGRTARPRQ